MIITCIISCAGYTKNIPVLQKCIASLLKAKTASTTLKIVITTNNSNHNITKNAYVNHIFTSPRSAGFVGINNKAVQKTIHKKSDYYLIINDDAWVNKSFFSQLESTVIKRKQVDDIIIPCIYDANKRELDSFGVEYFRTGYSKNSFSSTVSTTLASMSCLLIQTRFLKKMISVYKFFLNPLLTWYLDDVEFSIRARALGARFLKCKDLVAYHMRTYTWGRKSYFVIYQSFRNLLWVILLTWPKKIIVKHIVRIVCWQCIASLYCFIKYTPFLYPKILIATVLQWNALMKSRKKILKQYSNTDTFNTIFSSLEVRHNRLTF